MVSMRATEPSVNARRRYDATGRRHRADATRGRVLESAQDLLLRNGYASTTVAQIATAAAVSPETIYKSFGGKAGLVRAIRLRALQGEGPGPAEARADKVAERESDPLAIISNWAALAVEVAPRVVPILLLVRAAAAADPELASLQQELDSSRLARMSHNADYLSAQGHLRANVTRDQARDVLFTYSSPEIFELLVIRQRWSIAAYADFIRSGIAAALL